MTKNRSLVANALILAAIGILVAIYFTPIWWVSLTAPNYPEEAFPDGIRIHFHMNGVFNGCEKIENIEITEDEAIDCVHEMDTINHYVGMYPIAAGGVIERAFSPFLISMLAVMLAGFMFTRPAIRTGVLSAGFLIIIGWMYLTYYSDDGLKYQNSGYLKALITALDQDTAVEKKEMTAGEALIARLKASLNEADKQQAPAEKVGKNDKANSIQSLRVNFEKDQERKPVNERAQWDGSGAQMLSLALRKEPGPLLQCTGRDQTPGRHYVDSCNCRVLVVDRCHDLSRCRDPQEQQQTLLAAGNPIHPAAGILYYRLFRLAVVVWPHPQ